MIEMIDDAEVDFKLSGIVLFDLAIYRLMQEFKDVDWKSDTKVHYFIEKLLNDVFEIQKKHVKVKIRNLPS